MMIKTEEDIERDFYSFVKGSDLGKTIRGTVYRDGMRPADADTEDLIVKFIAGLDEQVQSGVVIFNIYVPDIIHRSDGRKVIDHARMAVLQRAIIDFVQNNDEAEYWMQTDTTPTSMLNKEIEQHLIYARIKFYRLAE